MFTNIKKSWADVKLSNKFLIPTIIIVIAGMSISALFTYIKAEDSIIQVQKENIKQLNNTISGQVNNFLSEIKTNIFHWSKDPMFITAVTDTYLDLSVRETANEKLQNIKQDYSYVESFILIDTKGTTLASDSALLPNNLIVSEKKYFKQAIKGQSVVSAVFESGMTGNPVFVVASPLVDFDNKIIGIFAATIRMEYFNKIIVEPIHPGKSGYAFVYDADGVVIAHKDKFNILDLNVSIYDYGKEMLKNKEGYITYSDDEGTKSISYRHIEDTGWTIAILANKNDILNSINEIAYISMLLVLLVTLLIAGLIYLIALSIIRPIEKVVKFTDSIARGDLDKKLDIKSKDEVGQLIHSVNSILVNLKLIVHQANNIAEGNFVVDMPSISKEDILTPALRKMATNLKEVTDLVHDVANGNLDGAIKIKSKKDILSKSINIMVGNLRSSSKSNEIQRHLEKFSRELTKEITGDLSINDYARKVIIYISEYFNIQVASYYSFENSKLIPVASYAVDNPAKNLKTYSLGEGLVGEAADRKKIIQISDAPDGYIKISSSLGKVSPHNLLIIPITYNNQLKAVFELGSFNKLTPDERILLDNVLGIIGINASVCQSRDKTNSLLGETQILAESLQAQQEELKSSNEELEEQTQLLLQSEEDLRTLNEELEDKTKSLEIQKKAIENKSTEIENKANELSSASKYKSEFLANMSHELRTPLNSLLILSKMLHDNKEGNLNNRQIEWARVIENSGNDLLDLINDILDLSKIEAGKIALDLSPINIDNLISSLTDKFIHLANEKNIDFIVDNKLGDIDTIHTDSQRLGQILKNLTSNAIKFTDTGSVTLLLQQAENTNLPGHSHLDPKNTIAISIIDTGIGIVNEKLEDIFKAFQQENGATSRKYGGTGLGLSISTELAHMLGGKISVKSIKDQGSTFTLYLPSTSNYESLITTKTDTPYREKQIALSSSNINQKKTIHVKTKNKNISETFIPDDRNNIDKLDKSILIIEDDKNFAQSLLELVRAHHYTGLAAGNGRNGIQMIERYKPTAILLDLGLPDMCGGEILLYVKESIELRHIPIHIISGREKNKIYLKQGAVGFLEKPINAASIDKMFEKINSIIDKEIKTILLVEDNKDTQIAISALLKNNFTRVTVATNIKKATQILDKEKIDCLLLDLGLPDSDGISFIKKLKEKCIDDCPVLIHTGRDLNNTELNDLNAIADSIIIKGAQSHDRLLDETMLFLHHLDTKLSHSQRSVIKSMRYSEDAFDKKKILLVDDDMRNIFALSGLLSEHSMHVTTAENGRDALEKLKNNSDFDLILMDIMMPIMDGYETMSAIRNNDDTKAIPIISLTAKAMPEDRDKCIASGANDYLAKPIDTEKLLSLMRVWLH